MATFFSIWLLGGPMQLATKMAPAFLGLAGALLLVVEPCNIRRAVVEEPETDSTQVGLMVCHGFIELYHHDQC